MILPKATKFQVLFYFRPFAEEAPHAIESVDFAGKESTNAKVEATVFIAKVEVQPCIIPVATEFVQESATVAKAFITEWVTDVLQFLAVPFEVVEYAASSQEFDAKFEAGED